MINKIGTTSYSRWLGGKKTYQIVVQQVDGVVAAHFASSMQIDVDGAPKAYHEADGGRPADQAEYDNNWDCFDWLKNLKPSDRHGRQGIDGAVGPAHGFTISATSLKDLTVANQRDTARYVDASVIPFIVLPADFPLADGTTHAAQIADCLGCLAYVVDLTSGHSTGAVFADVGPCSGEASLATALRLGRKPYYSSCFPKVSGIDSKRFFTIVFPNARLVMPLTVGDIQDRAQTLFQDWGGWTGLAAAMKEVAREHPPGASDDDIATLPLVPSKGPVDQNPALASRPVASYVTAASDVAMIDAPPDGGLVATLPAGTRAELIETLPHDDWLRVLGTIDGRLREGYVPAAPVTMHR